MTDSKILNNIDKKGGNRFKLCGNLPKLIQGAFEDKLIKNEGDKLTEEEARKLGYYFSCRKGLKPESPNQDNFLICEFENYKVFGVYDGHGPYGHDVSDFVARNMSRIVLEKIHTTQDNMNKILKDSFKKTQEELFSYCNKTEEFDVALSGTTATLAVLDTDAKKIWVAHVGDSRSIVCLCDSGKHKAKELTVDHKPTLPVEKKRIESRGGEVKKLEGDIPYRVFVRGKAFPGLAMSRAVGDLIANSVGVSCEPEVAEFDIPPTWDYIVLCSDGVWEFISPKTVTATIYQNKNDLKKGCTELAQQSWKRWIENEGDVVDDITVMVYDFNVLK